MGKIKSSYQTKTKWMLRSLADGVVIAKCPASDSMSQTRDKTVTDSTGSGVTLRVRAGQHALETTVKSNS